ncbi:MAG: hypothetical protein ACFFD2_18190 [Promethearchaeota archaeon]
MPQGMRFTIVDENLGKVEVNYPYHKIAACVFFVVGVIVMVLSIWAYFTYGVGLVVNILTGVIWFFAYFLLTYKNSVVINKLEGKVMQIRSMGIFYNKVRNVWDIDRVLHFEATKIGTIEEVGTSYSVGTGLGEFIGDSIISGTESSVPDLTVKTLVNLGVFIVKLKNGEMIKALQHRYEIAPSNCAKHATLFLKGKYTTPGTIYN